MATQTERRALFYEEDPDFNPCLVFDINEYLIECYPTMSLKQRKSVWSSCQSDPEFDYEPIEDQVDGWVEYLFGSDEEETEEEPK